MGATGAAQRARCRHDRIRIHNKGGMSMPRIAVGTENDAPIEIHYEDHGSVHRRPRGSVAGCFPSKEMLDALRRRMSRSPWNFVTAVPV